MERLFNSKYGWNDRANDVISMITMLDTYLFDDDAFIEILAQEDDLSYHQIRYKPFRKANCKSELYGLNDIYFQHRNFILQIIEVFFPDSVFTPCEIRNNKSNEYFLFMTLYAIHNIIWYQNIENSKPRGYERINKAINEAANLLAVFGHSGYTIEFPDHKNDTLECLQNLFKNANRKQQGKKAIDLIKQYFNIQRATATKKKKVENSYIHTSTIGSKRLAAIKREEKEIWELVSKCREAEKEGRHTEAEKIKQMDKMKAKHLLEQVDKESWTKTIMDYKKLQWEQTRRPATKFASLCNAYRAKK